MLFKVITLLLLSDIFVTSPFKDSDIFKYSKENKENVKRCPKCKNWIEKNKGCNHMTCIICKYEFCWLCMEESKPDHYNNPGTLCHGKQFPDEEIDPRMREAMEGLQNSSVFFYIFNLTFFLIRFFHNIYYLCALINKRQM